MKKIILSLFVIIVLSGAASADAAKYQRYLNKRDGVQAQVPADWQKAKTSAYGDDGDTFTDGKAIVSIYAQPETDTNVKTLMAAGNGETITAKSHQDNVIEISGTRGADIFYRKSALFCKGELWGNVSATYPAGDDAEYKPVIQYIVSTLKMGSTGLYENPSCIEDVKGKKPGKYKAITD